jgi:hypothetical protein
MRDNPSWPALLFMNHYFKKFSLLLCLAHMAASAHASTVTNANGTLSITNPPNLVSFAWDMDTNVDGYIIYYGQGGSRSYSAFSAAGFTNFVTVNLGQKTTNSVTWYFAVTDVVAGLESDFSGEVQYTPPTKHAPPTGLKPPLRLTVQEKKSAELAWSDTDMAWSLDPLGGTRLYRVELALDDTGSDPATIAPAFRAARGVPMIRIPLPPVPR